MLKCKEVALMISSDSLADASWRRRLAVRLHLLMCRFCRRYAAQLAAIDSATRARYYLEPRSHTDLKQTILSRLPAKQGSDSGDSERRPS